jgi:peptidoglycan biosynthesis protein MviN/MurJ (putative lipid II flippase)
MSSMHKVIGVILLVGGAVLIIVGIVASRSLADNFTKFFTGHFTQNTMWYIFGGIATGLVGLLLTIGVFGRPRS